MRLFVSVLFSVCFGLMSSLAIAQDAYQLRHGDSVFISVWGEDTLQKEVRVLPDGSLTFPLAGRVDVADQTTTETEQRLTDKLKEFLNDPQVTVVVTKTAGNLAYVIGKVVRTGPLHLSGPTTVLQALSLAGGFDKFADLGDIKVLRTKDGKQSTIHVNYDKLIQGGSLSSNIMLQPGDTILVP